MKCASCAADNPAGARYCVQCGAEQSVPTPIAAVAAAANASRPRNAVPQAANAAQAEPAHERLPTPPERAAAPWVRAAAGERLPPHDPTPQSTAHPSAAPPAYASAPGRTRLAALLIVLSFAVAAFAFIGWRVLQGDSRPAVDGAAPGDGDSVMSWFPPEATPRNPRRSAAGPTQGIAPPDSTPQGVSQSRATAGAPDEPAAAPGDPQAAATASTPPVEIKPLPAKPAPRSTRRQSDKAHQPAPAPPPRPTEPVAPRPPELAAVAPQPPPTSPVVDRWTRMRDELSRCTREDFIARVICDQRVRFRYCDGYWGKVTQCPGNPAPDTGQ